MKTNTKHIEKPINKGINTRTERCENSHNSFENLNAMLQLISNKLNLCCTITYK